MAGYVRKTISFQLQDALTRHSD